jgi:multiple sugar transport system permease protein
MRSQKFYSILIQTVVYVLLIELSFVILYPLLYMVINSFKDQADLLDINAKWLLQSGLYLENYKDAVGELNFGRSLATSFLITIFSTAGHVLSCSFVAYGLSRFEFTGKKLIMLGIVITVLVPMQILQIPLYIQYARIGWIGTIFPIIVPCFLGGGLRGGLFILVYYQFFKGTPKVYEEAAMLEGCGHLYIYSRILMPVCSRATIVVTTLSVLWHWLDIFESLAYLNGETKTVIQRLSLFPSYMYDNLTAGGSHISLAQFAACVLAILPVVVFLLAVQKEFIASAEESGYTG